MLIQISSMNDIIKEKESSEEWTIWKSAKLNSSLTPNLKRHDDTVRVVMTTRSRTWLHIANYDTSNSKRKLFKNKKKNPATHFLNIRSVAQNMKIGGKKRTTSLMCTFYYSSSFSKHERSVTQNMKIGAHNIIDEVVRAFLPFKLLWPPYMSGYHLSYTFSKYRRGSKV